MKIQTQIIWASALFQLFISAYADSTIPNRTFTPLPVYAHHVPQKQLNLNDKTADQAITLDLLGDGQPESFDAKTVTHWDSTGDADYSQVTLFQVGPDGGRTVILKHRYSDIVGISLKVSELDPKKPQKSFLLLTCAYGALVADLHIFQWDGKKFNEVENEGINWGSPAKMQNGVNAILGPAGSYGDEGPNIYTYQKGFLIPSNYQYPEMYQKDIAETLRFFHSKDGNPGVKLDICSRGLMRFLYAGRVQEGVRLYNQIWKLYSQFDESPQSDKGMFLRTALFRTYAYLAMGQKSAALEELWKLIPDNPRPKYQYDAYLGDYYYFKNDFKTALRYYTSADQELNGFRHPRTPMFDKKIKLLNDFLKS